MSKRTGFFARWKMERELVKHGEALDPKTPIAQQYQAWQARESAKVLEARQQTREARGLAYAMQRASWDRTQQAFDESRARQVLERPDPFAEWGQVYGRGRADRGQDGYER